MAGCVGHGCRLEQCVSVGSQLADVRVEEWPSRAKDMAPNSDGWRRYLALMLDAIAPRQTHPLPPVVPFVRPAMRI
jgi:hypothetical protein